MRQPTEKEIQLNKSLKEKELFFANAFARQILGGYKTRNIMNPLFEGSESIWNIIIYK